MAIPKFVWPVVAVVVGGGAILLSNRDPIGPGGLAIIRDPIAYQRENGIARDLTLTVFERANRGESIPEPDRAKLREAIPHLEAMNAYSPIKVGPYFALGQIYQILGQPDQAGAAYEQAIANEPTDYEEKDNPGLKLTVVEAKCLLSETLIDYAVRRAQDGANADELKRIRTSALTRADEAIKAQPNAPRYLAARASALLALGREEEAKAAIIAAAAADPNHFKVKPLAALVDL